MKIYSLFLSCSHYYDQFYIDGVQKVVKLWLNKKKCLFEELSNISWLEAWKCQVSPKISWQAIQNV